MLLGRMERDGSRKVRFYFELFIKKEGNVLSNDTLNTFYLWLYCVGHTVKDHSHCENGNPLLLFLISSKGSFVYTIPQTG